MTGAILATTAHPPAWASGLVAAVPVELDRETARTAARRELARREYQVDQPGLVERIITWLRDRVGELFDLAAQAAPGGWFGLVVVLLVVVAAVIAVRLRVGPLARAEHREQALFVGRERSAAEHRAAADEYATRQEWRDAVRERLRAVIRRLEERGLIDPRPGRTADEAAYDAGLVLPDCADDLAAAARVFDDVWYGGRVATAAHDQALRDLDQRLRAAGGTRTAAGRRTLGLSR